jgi:hypothetical protein
LSILFPWSVLSNGAADQQRRNREVARGADRLLQPLDGRREATISKRMVIRSPDGAARSVRGIND